MHSPQLPRELLADGKQHGKLMFVSDNRNQLTKLENFGKCFLSIGKRNRMSAFFLNKRNLLERELSTQYSERKRFVLNQSLET